MDCCSLGVIFIWLIGFTTLVHSALSLRSLDLALSSILAIRLLASLAGCHEPLCCLLPLPDGVPVLAGAITAAAVCPLCLCFFSFSPPGSLSGLHLRTDPLTSVDRLGGSSAALVAEMTLCAYPPTPPLARAICPCGVPPCKRVCELPRSC
jgi:hypothetical protein